mmetsp:Transcript_20975/g.44898  ORF Transcript_20975/g.44898 Transcript_20975/m.44898 type:complete len:135 (+) Transcript_20975:316-720(+)|eukprot:CAMPEP_0172553206 /NCGR_PEP_ID=MMETSP1067-20121228/49381_1 /TAXON_ID=265564 ORGANISM="Thalassiosira punctigera, Strain Tpunct2005C2" /NCGR_SAMPLE_ID=MMETSP1067 /ASSEMBLY_ACC=CAM_ASM_000444 /LENGTH=134 /DNA_ID=CAMNT_0013341351 /DNA_START=311 /DNA_END=715 /DNA_ORIENTATION=-
MSFSHGIAIDPDQIKDDITQGKIQMSDLFVTMCFFARLGFVQPPCCLKCAYRSAGCGEKTKNEKNYPDEKKGGSSSSCSELVAWRRDAGIALHPDKLQGNIVFVTCDTAKSLVNGDAYPSIRWDTRNKRLLHEI